MFNFASWKFGFWQRCHSRGLILEFSLGLYLASNCHGVQTLQRSSPPPLVTLAHAIVASSGTCHCYPWCLIIYLCIPCLLVKWMDFGCWRQWSIPWQLSKSKIKNSIFKIRWMPIIIVDPSLFNSFDHVDVDIDRYDQW